MTFAKYADSDQTQQHAVTDQDLNFWHEAIFSNNIEFTYVLDMRGCKYPTHFSVVQLYTSPSTPCHSMSLVFMSVFR